MLSFAKSAVFTLFILISMSGNSVAQSAAPKPCTAAECSQFDFWIGEWDLTYNDTVKATNRITREMGGCVVHEHFNDPSNAFTGESWSVYNPATKKWQQTWVDNQGGYIVLTGAYQDGRMILTTEAVKMPDGTTKQSRMVFDNITPDSLDWDWEATTDEGKNWKNNWRIKYKRKRK